VFERGSKMAQIFSCGYFSRRAFQRLPNRRWMVAEIVYQRHATGNAAHFHPAFDPLNVSNADWICWFFNPQCLAQAMTASRVPHVEFADQVQVKLEARNLKLRRRRAVTNIERLNCQGRVVVARASCRVFRLRFARAGCPCHWRQSRTA